MSKDTKPRVKLLGANGNAFNIMGLCSRAAKHAGWPKEKIDAVMAKMRAGDYDNLLGVAMTEFDVE